MLEKTKGFTLIEVMIVVVIIGILASIAYPSYVDYVTRSNRSEAHTALMRVANLEEQYYLDNRAYTGTLSDIGMTAATEHGYYEVSVSVESGGFTATAAAKGVQTRDTDCASISITDTGVKTPTGCWK